MEAVPTLKERAKKSQTIRVGILVIGGLLDQHTAADEFNLVAGDGPNRVRAGLSSGGLLDQYTQRMMSTSLPELVSPIADADALAAVKAAPPESKCQKRCLPL